MRPRISFAQYASDRLLEDRGAIRARWTAEMADVLGADPLRSGADALAVDVLDGALARLARYAEDGDDRALLRDDAVSASMLALGTWCARHGSDARAVVAVFDRLAAVLHEACREWARAFAGEPAAEEALWLAARLGRAPIVLAGPCVAAYENAWAIPGTRGDFTELLAHELSTPINAAEVAAVLLENDSVTPGSRELRRLAGTIQRSLRRVRALIGDIRDLSAAHGDGRDEDRRAAIGQVLAEVLAEVGPVARDAGVRIDIEEPIPPTRVPSARVAIVLRNLISNAIKYADPRADVRWVRVGFRLGPAGSTVVAVSDNGLGIPAHEHHRVFQRFVRLHPDTADGTGLGLAIARETALCMNGHLDFDSEPGVGSTFRLALPPDPAPRPDGHGP